MLANGTTSKPQALHLTMRSFSGSCACDFVKFDDCDHAPLLLSAFTAAHLNASPRRGRSSSCILRGCGGSAGAVIFRRILPLKDRGAVGGRESVGEDYISTTSAAPVALHIHHIGSSPRVHVRTASWRQMTRDRRSLGFRQGLWRRGCA